MSRNVKGRAKGRSVGTRARLQARIDDELAKIVERATKAELQPPRQHHIVPESYLTHWAEKGQIRVTDITENRPSFQTSPTRAAKERDFYRMESEDLDPVEIPPLLFETLLGEVEGRAAGVMDKLIAKSTDIDLGDVANLTTYMAFQATRTRSAFEQQWVIGNEVAKLDLTHMTAAEIATLAKTNDLDVSDQEIADAQSYISKIASGEIPYGPQRASIIGLAGKMAEQIAAIFSARAWVLLETGRVLVTSDNPILTIAGPGLPRDQFPGYEKAAVIIFPLAPSCALAMFRPDVAMKLGYVGIEQGMKGDRLDPVETNELNREIVMGADRWTFERPSKKVAEHIRAPGRTPQMTSASTVEQLENGQMRETRIFHTPTRWTGWLRNEPWPVARWWDS